MIKYNEVNLSMIESIKEIYRKESWNTLEELERIIH